MTTSTETFEYDNLDRLTKINGVVSTVYASNGNISHKSGVGNYTYVPGKPHAVETVANTSKLISDKEQNIDYTAFHKAEKITENVGNDAYELRLTYGPDQQRWKSELKRNNTTVKTIIYAPDYEQVTENGITKKLCYINGGSGLAAIYVKQSGQTDKIYYAHKDHLGSIIKLTDDNSSTVFQATYDAWGKQTITTNTFNFHRGYTGHEHLPEFALINMNGRMYDPILGRMLSPDNYVQAPDLAQSYNRYSYCLNNPLRYTDPDGEFWHLIIGAIVGGVINWATHGFQFNAEGLAYFGVGALAGALGAGIGAGISSMLPVAGTASGGFAAGFLGTSAATTATSSFVSGALIGGGAGAISGFTTGFGNALVEKQSFSKALGQGGIYGLIGGGSGALLGGITGGISAVRDGREFWDGARMIDEQTLANQNLPLIQQRGDYNCGPATGESTTGVPQDRYRTIIGGEPNKDPVTIAQLNDAIQTETGRSASPFLNTLPTDKTSAEQLAEMMDRGNKFYMASTNPGEPIGHTTALNSVSVRTFQKISGKLYYKVVYQAMDPFRGVYKIIGANSMRTVIRIYP
ncbi:MAG: RHS repeat-associated core domain-containing protein [Prevotellaceae bacterium]|jgi:RHS repeat-associated protein|nr:RHS repeat-associated core domain-containing protein [Prevotellaceae bacterium]